MLPWHSVALATSRPSYWRDRPLDAAIRASPLLLAARGPGDLNGTARAFAADALSTTGWRKKGAKIELRSASDGRADRRRRRSRSPRRPGGSRAQARTRRRPGLKRVRRWPGGVEPRDPAGRAEAIRGVDQGPRLSAGHQDRQLRLGRGRCRRRRASGLADARATCRPRAAAGCSTFESEDPALRRPPRRCHRPCGRRRHLTAGCRRAATAGSGTASASAAGHGHCRRVGRGILARAVERNRVHDPRWAAGARVGRLSLMGAWLAQAGAVLQTPDTARTKAMSTMRRITRERRSY